MTGLTSGQISSGIGHGYRPSLYVGYSKRDIYGCIGMPLSLNVLGYTYIKTIFMQYAYINTFDVHMQFMFSV